VRAALHEVRIHRKSASANRGPAAHAAAERVGAGIGWPLACIASIQPRMASRPLVIVSSIVAPSDMQPGGVGKLDQVAAAFVLGHLEGEAVVTSGSCLPRTVDQAPEHPDEAGLIGRRAGMHCFPHPRMRKYMWLPLSPRMLMPKPRATTSRSSIRSVERMGRAPPPVCWRLPRRGHGFPGSHGPPERRVNSRWLTRRYRRPAAAGKNSSNRLPSQLVLYASNAVHPTKMPNEPDRTTSLAQAGNHQTNPTVPRRSAPA
jgi:hypothetical protein